MNKTTTNFVIAQENISDIISEQNGINEIVISKNEVTRNLVFSQEKTPDIIAVQNEVSQTVISRNEVTRNLFSFVKKKDFLCYI